MGPLREVLEKAGLNDVRTYIQSGNIIAASKLTRPALENLVHEVIRKSFGGDIAVVARTAEQFADILKRNPFAGADGARLYFSLLATEPDKKLLKALLSTDFSPDQVRYANRTIYARYTRCMRPSTVIPSSTTTFSSASSKSQRPQEISTLCSISLL